MTNEYYYACGMCGFLLSDKKMECPHCIRKEGVKFIGNGEKYADMDSEYYNKGFPYGHEHKCDRCNDGKMDLNFKFL